MTTTGPTHTHTHFPHTFPTPRPFNGPVAGRYGAQNPAAHGGVCHVEECLICGARRSVNVNGLHREFGSWGPSLARRRAYAIQAERTASDAIAAVGEMSWPDGRQVGVDHEGFVIATGPDHESAADWLAIEAPEFLAAAIAARRLVLAAQAARARV